MATSDYYIKVALQPGSLQQVRRQLADLGKIANAITDAAQPKAAPVGPRSGLSEMERRARETRRLNEALSRDVERDQQKRGQRWERAESAQMVKEANAARRREAAQKAAADKSVQIEEQKQRRIAERREAADRKAQAADQKALARQREMAEAVARRKVQQTLDVVDPPDSRGLRLFRAETEAMMATGGPVQRTLAQLGSSLYTVEGSAYQAAQALSRGNLSMRQFAAATVQTAAQMATWGGGAAALFGVISVLNQVKDAALDANEGINSLQRVAETGFNADAAGGEMIRLMQELNVGAKDVGTAAYEMGKVFHDQTQAFDAANAVLLASKVAEIDVVEASKDLIATTAAYGLEARDMTDIVHKLNEEQNKLGVGLPKTLMATARAASVVGAAGGQLDPLIARIAVLQRYSGFAPETIARQQARLAQSLSSTSGQEKIKQALAGTDVSLIDEEGEVKNLDRLMRDVASRWQSFSAVQKTNISNALVGGSAGGGQLVTLTQTMFNNWARITEETKNVEDATNGVGSAYRELAIVQQSLRERMNEINSEVEAIGVNLARSGFGEVFGFTLTVMRELLEVSNDLLGAWADMPKPFRVMAASIASIVAGYRLMSSLAGPASAVAGAVGLGIVRPGAVASEAHSARYAALKNLESQSLLKASAATEANVIATNTATAALARQAAAQELVALTAAEAAVAETAQATATQRSAASRAGAFLGSGAGRLTIGLGAYILGDQVIERTEDRRNADSIRYGSRAFQGAAAGALLGAPLGLPGIIGGGAIGALSGGAIAYHEAQAERDRALAESFSILSDNSRVLSETAAGTAKEVGRLGEAAQDAAKREKINFEPDRPEQQSRDYREGLSADVLRLRQQMMQDASFAAYSIAASDRGISVGKRGTFNQSLSALSYQSDGKAVEEGGSLFRDYLRDLGISKSGRDKIVWAEDVENALRSALEARGLSGPEIDREVEIAQSRIALWLGEEMGKSSRESQTARAAEILREFNNGNFENYGSGKLDFDSLRDKLNAGGDKRKDAIAILRDQRYFFADVMRLTEKEYSELLRAVDSGDYGPLNEAVQKINAYVGGRANKGKLDRAYAAINGEGLDGVNDEFAGQVDDIIEYQQGLRSLIATADPNSSEMRDKITLLLTSMADLRKDANAPGNEYDVDLARALQSMEQNFTGIIDDMIQNTDQMVNVGRLTERQGLSRKVKFLNALAVQAGKVGDEGGQSQAFAALGNVAAQAADAWVEGKRRELEAMVRNTRSPRRRQRLRNAYNAQINDMLDDMRDAATDTEALNRVLRRLGLVEAVNAVQILRGVVRRRAANNVRLRGLRRMTLAQWREAEDAVAAAREAGGDTSAAAAAMRAAALAYYELGRQIDANRKRLNAARERLKSAQGGLAGVAEAFKSQALDSGGDIPQEANLPSEALDTPTEDPSEAVSAKYEYLKALVAGDPVKVARLELQEANALASFAKTTAERFRAKAAIVTAQRNLTDAILQERQDDIQFNLEMGKISTQRAIEMYRGLLKLKGITKAQKRDILRTIRQLTGDAADSQTFGIPAEINLPTAFEVRAAVAGGLAGKQLPVGEPVGAIQQRQYNNRNTITINVRSEEDMRRVREVVYDATGEDIQRAKSIGFGGAGL